MDIKKFVKIILTLLVIFYLIHLLYLKFSEDKKTNINETPSKSIADMKYNSNIIKGVQYTTKDKKNNEYFIKAAEGEIDFANSNIIFLKDVYTLIKLNNDEEVKILSDFGKYDSLNFSTIFSKNVIINYLDSKITGEYLELSLEKNFMIISKNVIYKNKKNYLKADVIELDIKSNDIKIFMHENERKIKIKNSD